MSKIAQMAKKVAKHMDDGKDAKLTRTALKMDDRASRRQAGVKKRVTSTIKTLGAQAAATSAANTQQREETKRVKAQYDAARAAQMNNLASWNSILGSNPTPEAGEAGDNGTASTGDYGLDVSDRK